MGQLAYAQPCETSDFLLSMVGKEMIRTSEGESIVCHREHAAAQSANGSRVPDDDLVKPIDVTVRSRARFRQILRIQPARY